MELWIGLYNSIKDIWFVIFIPVVISIIKLLNKNDLYQSENIEKLKMIFKNTWLFILMTIAALIYLLTMISFSLMAYPKEGYVEYLSNWENIRPFVILMIMYAMLFPIITISFLGERKNKRYFIEIIHNNIMKREVVDRIYRRKR